MPRESPPARRVTALLDAVVAHPGRAQSLAALAKATGISKATCLGILNELCDAGWLARDAAAKTYRPGGAMLAAGIAAQQGYAAVDLARPHLQRLSDELGCVATASAVVDDHVTVLARTGDPQVAPAIRVGQRYPFLPPSGVMFVAWDGERAVQDWLARRPLEPFHAELDQMPGVAAACRRDGYLVECLGEVNTDLYSLLVELGDGEVSRRLGELLRRSRSPRYLLGPIRPRASYDVSLACAPVFGAGGRTEIVLAVIVMRTGVAGSALRGYVDALTRTAAAVTALVGGHDPHRAVTPA